MSASEQQQQQQEPEQVAPKMIRGEARYTEEYCKSILITGGVGFVGSHVVEMLMAEGRKVVILDIFNNENGTGPERKSNATMLKKCAAKHGPINGAQLDIIYGDYTDTELISKIVQEHQITSVMHLAALADDRQSVFESVRYMKANVVGTTILMEHLGKIGIKMVVMPSTRSVFGANVPSLGLHEGCDRRPVNPYGASRVATDAIGHCMSHLYDFNMTLIRIFGTYGPRGRPDMLPRIMIEHLVNEKPFKKFGDGTATRTWTYISDVAAALVLALKHPRGGFDEFNTGAPNITSLNEMIECAEKVTGKKALIHQYPTPPGDPLQVGHPNYDKISRELGWYPKVGVLEGLKGVYEHYLEKLATQDATKKDITPETATVGSKRPSVVAEVVEEKENTEEMPPTKRIRRVSADSPACDSPRRVSDTPSTWETTEIVVN